MKKGFISILLVVTLLFTLASCGAMANDAGMDFAPGAEADADGNFFYNTVVDESLMDVATGTILVFLSTSGRLS